jgi:molybdate transport system regulatory protein
MAISARNVFNGKVSAVTDGAVNAEVEITTAGGDKIVAMVTETSVKSLGLAVGTEVIAVVKAPSVTLLSGTPAYRFSARNQLPGTVSSVTKGAVNSQVALTLAGGSTVVAVVTNDAVAELALAQGTPVVALFKAGQVLVGVPA